MHAQKLMPTLCWCTVGNTTNLVCQFAPSLNTPCKRSALMSVSFLNLACESECGCSLLRLTPAAAPDSRVSIRIRNPARCTTVEAVGAVYAPCQSKFQSLQTFPVCVASHRAFFITARLYPRKSIPPPAGKNPNG
jgi:hypothetical protein